MNFSLHYSIKYFKNNNCFPSILIFFFFQLMRLFRKDFQRNVQHSIQMSDITKRNSNVHFILGNTGHALSIKYFKNNNCFPSIWNLFFFFFSVKASFSEGFPEKCSTFHSNVGHYKEKFERSFHSRKYWSRVTWLDCNPTPWPQNLKKDLWIQWAKSQPDEFFDVWHKAS